jgi:sugar phosphate isomerase/epimerase
MAAGGLTNPFFVLEDGLGPQTEPLGSRIALVKKIGFDGMDLENEGPQSIPEMLKALDERGLKLFCQYLWVDISGKQTVYQPGLEESVRLLKGRDTLIWLTIRGNGPDAEQRAIEAARTVGDMAARSGLRVALYPHFGLYVARPEDAIRVADKAGRGNLGVTFNLCHWLRVGGGENVQAVLQQAMPRLWAVTINGADHQGDWDRLIQPLDRGDFDIEGFLKVLVGLGYRGPIGLQCYGIQGNVEENLRRSMRAWREMSSRVAAVEPHAKSPAKTSE